MTPTNRNPIDALAEVLGRAPRRLVIVSVDVADTGYGTGLSDVVAQAVP